MLYESERQHLTTVLEELRTWGALNPAGGAVSVRADHDRIVMSASGSAFRRWHSSTNDFIVLNNQGDFIGQTGGLGASGTPLHLALYRMLPKAGAIVHAHGPYSLAFASLGREVPSVTNRCDTLGHIPCLSADDSRVKQEYLAAPFPLDLPQGVVQRPEVAVVNLLHYEPQAEKLIAPRADELERHGLAFTLYRHGAITVGRQLDEALDLMLRVEESARTALMQTMLTGGQVHTNPLFGAAA